MSPARILVTGSRNWTDVRAVREALLSAVSSYSTIGTPVLVHGGARGLDTIAARVWEDIAETLAEANGCQVLGFSEAHPADWATHGKAAGPIRNQAMVDLGAIVCLAFPLGESRGTWDCVRRAEAAGITVLVRKPTTATT